MEKENHKVIVNSYFKELISSAVANRELYERKKKLKGKKWLMLFLNYHLFFEAIMNDMLLLLLGKTRGKQKQRFGFAQKVEVLDLMGGIQEERLKEFLLFLNKIRNEYVHNWEFDFPEGDYKKLMNFSPPLPSKMRKKMKIECCMGYWMGALNHALTALRCFPIGMMYLQHKELLEKDITLDGKSLQDNEFIKKSLLQLRGGTLPIASKHTPFLRKL